MTGAILLSKIPIFLSFKPDELEELADMVGAIRESINKELRILREKGLIRLTKNSIIICDINRLRRRIH